MWLVVVCVCVRFERMIHGVLNIGGVKNVSEYLNMLQVVIRVHLKLYITIRTPTEVF